MTKLVFISDTHCQLHKVKIPDGDILIHSGDLTYNGSIEQVSQELTKLKKISAKFQHVVLVCGNHDWLGQKNSSLMRQMCADNNVIYLEDEAITLEGLKIYGSPWQPAFCNWAFNKERGAEINKYWDMIPDDTNILVTHGGPYGIGDICPDGFVAGCKDLLYRIHQLDKLKIHCFGHIHGGRGVYKNKLRDIIFINASICDEDYRPTNKPIMVEL